MTGNPSYLLLVAGVSLVLILWWFTPGQYPADASGVWRSPPRIVQRLFGRRGGAIHVTVAAIQISSWAMILGGLIALVVPDLADAGRVVSALGFVGLFGGGFLTIIIANALERRIRRNDKQSKR